MTRCFHTLARAVACRINQVTGCGEEKLPRAFVLEQRAPIPILVFRRVPQIQGQKIGENDYSPAESQDTRLNLRGVYFAILGMSITNIMYSLPYDLRSGRPEICKTLHIQGFARACGILIIHANHLVLV